MVPKFLSCARRGLILAALPLATTLTLGTEAIAQQSDTKAQYAKEIGASERVNFSGKLRWSALEPFVLATLAGESLDAADRATVFHGMNQMTANMNKVVGLYSEASKQTGSM
jgi:hypothetical protein